ncbi:IMP cyclohydrolase [Thermotoga caldifontis]|uniref:IMP cyclohydrolase n=1 Tax=Thermotoga caldifontis TaxID=1508419 RepID=UPI00059773C1|nr:IMP cyclohydrolase [Thermotoga caldifontis]
MNIKRALISVWDKRRVAEFAKALSERKVEIFATSGTAAYLRSCGVNAKEISEITGFSEMLQGNVKTIHPKIFAAVLMNLFEEDYLRLLKEMNIEPFDLVAVNLRPFQLDDSLDEERILKSIDVGGVALLRAAAKNYRNVVTLCDPEDYDAVIESIDRCGDVELQKRRLLCVKAFLTCQKYDESVIRVLCDLFAVDPEQLKRNWI